MEVQGVVTGKADVRAPYKQISDTTAWIGTAKVTSPELVIARRSAKNAKLVISVGKGVATLKELSAMVEEIPVNATGTLGLTGKYPFTASLTTSGTNLADLRKLAPEAELPAPVEGILNTETSAAGTVSPFTFSAGGTIHATRLTLAKTPANRVELKWQLTPERLVISSLQAKVFEGTLSGKANLPFAADQTGSFQLAFKSINLAAAMPLVPAFPVAIGGLVSGDIQGTIPPRKEGQPRIGKLNVDLSAPKLTVQGIPAERLVGKAAIKNGVLDYSLQGKTLGGTFELKGRDPGLTKNQREPKLAPAPVRSGWGGGIEAVRLAMSQPGPVSGGSFQLTGAILRLARDLNIPALRGLHGRLNVTFNFANDLTSGSGRVLLTGVKWNDAVLTRACHRRRSAGRHPADHRGEW